MDVISGLGGSVNGQSTTRRWSVNRTSDNQAYGASNTRGGTARVPGNKDWTGSLDAYGHTPGLFPGEAFTFRGNGAEDVTGDAVTESIEITCDIEGGGIISNTVQFGGNGPLAEDTGTAFSDTTTPTAPTSIGCKVQRNTTDVDNVRSWSLSITSDLQAYNDSSTGGQTRRKARRLDARGSYAVNISDFADLPAEGSKTPIRLYVNATEYWAINSTIIDSVKPEVDSETGELVGATVNWSWDAMPAGAAGSITKPGASTASWPA